MGIEKVKKNLYDLANDYADVVNQIESYCFDNKTDEVPEELMQKLTVSKENINQKILGYSFYVRKTEKIIETNEELIKSIQSRNKALLRSIDFCKERMIDAVETFGEQKKNGSHFIDTGMKNISVSRTFKCKITDPELIPEKYFKIEPKKTIIKKDINKDWKNGEKIPGVERGEDTIRLTH